MCDNHAQKSLVSLGPLFSEWSNAGRTENGSSNLPQDDNCSGLEGFPVPAEETFLPVR
jgi:hypothetical protein